MIIKAVPLYNVNTAIKTETPHHAAIMIGLSGSKATYKAILPGGKILKNLKAGQTCTYLDERSNNKYQFTVPQIVP